MVLRGMSMEQVSCCFITVVYPGLDKLPYGEGNDIFAWLHLHDR